MTPRRPLLPLHPSLREAFDPVAFRAFGHNLVDRLADHLDDSVGRRRPSSYPVGTPEEELAYWKAFMARSGSRDEAICAVLERSNQLHDPRYMGHQVAVPFPQEAMLGALTDLLNNGQAIYEMGPTNATLEHVLLNEVGKALGLPEECGGVLCHGGTLGNLVALLAAQRKLGMRLDQDPWRHGIRQADPFVVLVSEQAHYCVDRAVRIMGWGPDAVVLVKTDAHHRMDVTDLARQAEGQRKQGKKLLAVVGSACTTSAGAYDPLQDIAEWAHAEDVWFHVDGAHGAPAGFSGTHKHLVRGMSLADSVVLDFHKVCGLPALLTGVLYRESKESFLPFVQEAEYLWENAEGQDWWDTGKRTFECTKRMLSTRLATAMFDGGMDKWGHLVDRLWSLAEVFAKEVKSRPAWELAMTPQANIVCFRPAAASGDADLVTKLRGRHLKDGASYVVATRLDGEAWLRCTFMNPLTELEDMQTMLDEFEGWMAEA